MKSILHKVGPLSCINNSMYPRHWLVSCLLTTAGLVWQVLTVGITIAVLGIGDAVTWRTLEMPRTTRLQLWKENPRVRVSVRSTVSKERWWSHSPQSRSSELSPQSFSLSHSHVPGMHCSLSQRNSLSEQGLGTTRPHQEHIQNRQQSMNSDFVSIVSNKRKETSKM